jgi:hypothetical protein
VTALRATFFHELRRPSGLRVSLDFPYFVAEVLPHAGEKSALPLVSFATYKGDRRALATVESVTAIAFDIDEPLASIDELVEKLALVAPLAWQVHTSFSSAPGALRFRVIAPVSRPMAPEEQRAIWPVFAAGLADAGVEVDGACKDPSRAYYVPAVPPNGVYSSRSLEGAPLDVDACLRVAGVFQEAEQIEREAEAALAARRLARAPTRAGNSLSPIDRARAYLASVPVAVSGQHGHARTFDLAMRLVRGFALSDAEALALMAPWNASCSPPWPAQALARKVAEARAKGNMPFGHLLERGRRIA